MNRGSKTDLLWLIKQDLHANCAAPADENVTLGELGIDSLGVMELVLRLHDKLDIDGLHLEHSDTIAGVADKVLLITNPQ